MSWWERREGPVAPFIEKTIELARPAASILERLA